MTIPKTHSLRITFTKMINKFHLWELNTAYCTLYPDYCGAIFLRSGNLINDLLFTLVTSKCLLKHLSKLSSLSKVFFILNLLDKTICLLENDKRRIALLISYFNKVIKAHIFN